MRRSKLINEYNYIISTGKRIVKITSMVKNKLLLYTPFSFIGVHVQLIVWIVMETTITCDSGSLTMTSILMANRKKIAQTTIRLFSLPFRRNICRLWLLWQPLFVCMITKTKAQSWLSIKRTYSLAKNRFCTVKKMAM